MGLGRRPCRCLRRRHHVLPLQAERREKGQVQAPLQGNHHPRRDRRRIRWRIQWWGGRQSAALCQRPQAWKGFSFPPPTDDNNDGGNGGGGGGGGFGSLSIPVSSGNAPPPITPRARDSEDRRAFSFD